MAIKSASVLLAHLAKAGDVLTHVDGNVLHVQVNRRNFKNRDCYRPPSRPGLFAGASSIQFKKG